MQSPPAQQHPHRVHGQCTPSPSQGRAHSQWSSPLHAPAAAAAAAVTRQVSMNCGRSAGTCCHRSDGLQLACPKHSAAWMHGRGDSSMVYKLTVRGADALHPECVSAHPSWRPSGPSHCSSRAPSPGHHHPSAPCGPRHPCRQASPPPTMSARRLLKTQHKHTRGRCHLWPSLRHLTCDRQWCRPRSSSRHCPAGPNSANTMQVGTP
jgi:hypothetical protein